MSSLWALQKTFRGKYLVIPADLNMLIFQTMHVFHINRNDLEKRKVSVKLFGFFLFY